MVSMPWGSEYHHHYYYCHYYLLLLLVMIMSRVITIIVMMMISVMTIFYVVVAVDDADNDYSRIYGPHIVEAQGTRPEVLADAQISAGSAGLVKVAAASLALDFSGFGFRLSH